MVMQITTLLAWIAGPLALLAMVDDWFLRPGRRLASLPDPPLMRAVYRLLPVAVVGSIVRLLASEQLDFSLVLVLVLVAAALVRGLDAWLLAPRRARAAAREIGAVVVLRLDWSDQPSTWSILLIIAGLGAVLGLASPLVSPPWCPLKD